MTHTHEFPEPPAARRWAQLSLIPHDVCTLTIRVGYVLSANHWQCQFEVHAADTGRLISLTSVPHMDEAAARTRVLDEVRRFLADALSPF